MRPASSLQKDACVVIPLIRILEARGDLLRPGERVPQVLLELIGQREEKRDEDLLVVRIGPQNVTANALGLLRLVEQAVVPGALESALDGFLRKGLQIELNGASLALSRFGA